eukprot:tig00001214_g7545.t1
MGNILRHRIRHFLRRRAIFIALVLTAALLATFTLLPDAFAGHGLQRSDARRLYAAAARESLGAPGRDAQPAALSTLALPASFLAGLANARLLSPESPPPLDDIHRSRVLNGDGLSRSTPPRAQENCVGPDTKVLMNTTIGGALPAPITMVVRRPSAVVWVQDNLAREQLMYRRARPADASSGPAGATGAGQDHAGGCAALRRHPWRRGGGGAGGGGGAAGGHGGAGGAGGALNGLHGRLAVVQRAVAEGPERPVEVSSDVGDDGGVAAIDETAAQRRKRRAERRGREGSGPAPRPARPSGAGLTYAGSRALSDLLPPDFGRVAFLARPPAALGRGARLELSPAQKVDVEGFEVPALRSAHRLFHRRAGPPRPARPPAGPRGGGEAGQWGAGWWSSGRPRGGPPPPRPPPRPRPRPTPPPQLRVLPSLGYAAVLEELRAAAADEPSNAELRESAREREEAGIAGATYLLLAGEAADRALLEGMHAADKEVYLWLVAP